MNAGSACDGLGSSGGNPARFMAGAFGGAVMVT